MLDTTRVNIIYTSIGTRLSLGREDDALDDIGLCCSFHGQVLWTTF